MKLYQGESETAAKVDAQLNRYRWQVGLNYGVWFEFGTELQDWANAFKVSDDFWDYLNGKDFVYVWGLNLPPGHVYVGKNEHNRVPNHVRVRGELKREQNLDKACNWCLPIPPIIRVPVPVP